MLIGTALCRAVAVADSSRICAACIEACNASVHISSDGLLLAVCEDSRIRTWAMRDLLSGDQHKPLCEWTLGGTEIVKQVSHLHLTYHVSLSVRHPALLPSARLKCTLKSVCCVQFSWRPGQASQEPAEAFVVTDTGRLLNATLGGQLASDREGHLEAVSCAAWSPEGSLLAFASGSRVIVAAADSSGLFRATAKLPVTHWPILECVSATAGHASAGCCQS